MASSSQKRRTSATAELSDSSVYHEKQSRWRCGLHAVNALLGSRVFTPSDFDEIADSLLLEGRKPWFHPHRSVLGMGDYDVNVLLVALEKEGLSSTWVSNQDALPAFLGKDTLSGFLINIELTDWIHTILKLIVVEGRHWVAVPRYGNRFVMVDSKAQSPVTFRTTAALLDYMEKVRANAGHIIAIEKSSSETRSQ